jgi:WhiB family transcriptional regulator, redox-sensing transcriptional regulator
MVSQFPLGGNDTWRSLGVEQIDSAKAVCTACAAQPACLEFALATNQESGIWGGTSEDERRKMRKSWLAEQRRAAS